MQGVHLTADLYGCRCARTALTDVADLSALVERLVLEAGLTVVGRQWVGFEAQPAGPGGVTGALLLAESHVAVHTWPEWDQVTVDVYVCNLRSDNSERAHALMRSLIAAFQPQRVLSHELLRGAAGDAAVHGLASCTAADRAID
jgi:S-adenosylmethionine decarboxylase proenzyme